MKQPMPIDLTSLVQALLAFLGGGASLEIIHFIANRSNRKLDEGEEIRKELRDDVQRLEIRYDALDKEKSALFNTMQDALSKQQIEITKLTIESATQRARIDLQNVQIDALKDQLKQVTAERDALKAMVQNLQDEVRKYTNNGNSNNNARPNQSAQSA